MIYSAICLHQPYASLIPHILDGRPAKPFETRGRPAPARVIGHRIAIHAALRKPTLEEREVPAFVRVLGRDWHERVPYGALICTAVVAGSYQVERWDGLVPILHGRGAVTDDGFGDYSVGRWCWELTDVLPLTPPIPAIGQRNWFSVDLP